MTGKVFSGTSINGYKLADPLSNPFSIAASGLLNNSGMGTYALGLYGPAGTTWTITNSGTIKG